MRVIDCPGERRVRENRMHGVGGGGRKRVDDAQPKGDRWVAYRWRASRLPHLQQAEGQEDEPDDDAQQRDAVSAQRAVDRGVELLKRPHCEAHPVLI